MKRDITKFSNAFIPKWTEAFTERQIKEIDFSIAYAEDYGHGTDGHNAKIIIAKMAKMLSAVGRGKTIKQAVSENDENKPD